MLATAVTWIANGSWRNVNVNAPSISTRSAIVRWPSSRSRRPLRIVTGPVSSEPSGFVASSPQVSALQAWCASALVTKVTVRASAVVCRNRFTSRRSSRRSRPPE